VLVDPGPPPRLGDPVTDAILKQDIVEVIRDSAMLDGRSKVKLDISPTSRGNNDLATNDGFGYSLYPLTGKPYEAQVVRRADNDPSVPQQGSRTHIKSIAADSIHFVIGRGHLFGKAQPVQPFGIGDPQIAPPVRNNIGRAAEQRTRNAGVAADQPGPADRNGQCHNLTQRAKMLPIGG